MIQINKQNNNIVLSLVNQLDREDVIELVNDLTQWLKDTQHLPKFDGMSDEDVKKSKAYTEAKAQNESKNKLAKEMQRVFVDVLDTEYLETKFATTYKLDAINREVEVLRKKLNKL